MLERIKISGPIDELEGLLSWIKKDPKYKDVDITNISEVQYGPLSPPVHRQFELYEIIITVTVSKLLELLFQEASDYIKKHCKTTKVEQETSEKKQDGDRSDS